MTCTFNGNHKFNNLLFDSNLINKDLPDFAKAFQRRRLYLTFCIMLRLAMAGIVLQLKDKHWLPYVIGVICLYPIVNLGFFSKPGEQWWSNTFQLVVSIALFLACLLLIFSVNIPTFVLPLILYISVIGGVFQAMLIPSC
jgi:hypothetical protein